MHMFRTLGLIFRKTDVTSTATLFHIQDCFYRRKTILRRTRV